MSKQNNALATAQGVAQDFSDVEKKVMALADFKEACIKIVKLKECTNTQKKWLRSIYSDLQLKLNQGTFF